MVHSQESITAKLCAFTRAWHSNKSKQKVFDDYLAYDMIGKDEYDNIYNQIKHGFGILESPLSDDDTAELINQYVAPIVLSRTDFTENSLKAFTEKYGKIQYVICGAGSDTFSFRNDNPDIQIYEIDHPDTQKCKIKKIKKLEWIIPENVHFIPVDFEKEKMTEKLLSAGFNPKVKTFFSILGVSYYLTLSTLTATLSEISNLSADGSIVAFDYPEKTENTPQRFIRLEKIADSMGEIMKGGFTTKELESTLNSLGFKISNYFYPEKIQNKYFQNRKDGLKAFENIIFLSASYTEQKNI